jgi:hypothetical protein
MVTMVAPGTLAGVWFKHYFGTGADYPGNVLASAIGDSALTEIVRSQLNRNAVTWHNAYEMLPHFTGDMSDYFVAILKFDAKLRSGERFDYCSRQLNDFFINRHKT